jgi:leader peptidase (prepilin peptidase)/N-methyltransferase
MGLGDVKFMGAIGAFIGWQGAVFSLAWSVRSSARRSGWHFDFDAGRREWSSRMPYGPYIALAAVIWILAGRNFSMRCLPCKNNSWPRVGKLEHI